MNFELLKNVVAELAETLSGARVSKIYQPSPEILIFKLWTGRETLRLLVSAEGAGGRFHLTEQSWPNPAIPPRFCQLLRARISRINSFQIVHSDRIVRLDCSGKHGDCRLLIELTGHDSNLLLIDASDVIIDVLKRPSGQRRGRPLLAGEKYQLPEKRDHAAVPQSEWDQEVACGSSWNQTVEKHYSQGKVIQNKMDFRRQLVSTVQKNVKKLKKRIVEIEKDLVEQDRADRYRHLGDLVLSNLYVLKQGMKSVQLRDYSIPTENSVTVSLDPLLTPQQNAEKYFRKFKKLKRGREHSKRRLTETQAELRWLEQIYYQLDDTVKNSDIEEIAEELRKAGILKEKNNLHKKRTLQPSIPHKTLSPSGYTLLWGRNNRQNDEISMRIARATDMWFHAHQTSGTHVLLQLPAGQEASEDDIHFAAAVAAGYSRVKNEYKVEVMVAEAKNLRKPKGAKAGQVTVLHYKTVVVQPHRCDN